MPGEAYRGKNCPGLQNIKEPGALLGPGNKYFGIIRMIVTYAEQGFVPGTVATTLEVGTYFR